MRRAPYICEKYTPEVKAAQAVTRVRREHRVSTDSTKLWIAIGFGLPSTGILSRKNFELGMRAAEIHQRLFLGALALAFRSRCT
jgi:hypothetical protein